MSKKVLNTQYELLEFSILDDEDSLMKESDKSVCKIFLYSIREFHCSIQAWYDLAESIIAERDMKKFCHLLNVYKDNIYIANTKPLKNKPYGCYVESFTNQCLEDTWDPVNHAKSHIQYIINLLVSIDFDVDNDKIWKWFQPVYLNDHKVIHILYSMLGNCFHHDNGLFIDIAKGTYREFDEYETIKCEIMELMKIEMN